jgi:hypothetical protein
MRNWRTAGSILRSAEPIFTRIAKNESSDAVGEILPHPSDGPILKRLCERAKPEQAVPQGHTSSISTRIPRGPDRSASIFTRVEERSPLHCWPTRRPRQAAKCRDCEATQEGVNVVLSNRAV